MTRFASLSWLLAAAVLAGVGCARPTVATAQTGAARGQASTPLDGSRQMVLVVTPGWDSTTGTLRRFARTSVDAPWQPVGAAVPIVVGRTGLAWDDSQARPSAREPVKREGDGRSPAGAFLLDASFGFDIRQIMSWVRLPYIRLRATTECVDDSRSVHYNAIVDRDSVPRVDWTSSEKMREIEQYAYGVHVAYNTPPRASRGSCIFLHIWAGPQSVTAGCTAMSEPALKELMGWIDPERKPMLVQLPTSAMERMRARWRLP